MSIQKKQCEIGREKLKEWEQEFQSFMHPKVMMTMYETRRNQIGLEELYNRGGLNFLMEAYLTGKYGLLIQAKKVRLIDQNLNLNDCEVVVEEKRLSFEITEILKKGRKRGDEYKGGKESGEEGTTEREMLENLSSGFCDLRTAIIKKSKKGYDKSVGLIVYFNISNWGDDDRLVKGITRVLETVDYEFPTIDVLHDQSIFRFTKCDRRSVTCSIITH